MTEVLAHLPWPLAIGLTLMVLLALALRRWGGAFGLRAGAMLAWLGFLVALAWAGLALYDAMALLQS